MRAELEAEQVDVEDQIESRMRSDGSRRGAVAGVDRLSGPMVTQLVTEFPYLALRMDAVHRLDRISVRPVDLVRHGATLPDAPAGLLALCGDPHLLAGGGVRLNLTYHKLSPDRFRIELGPGADPPDFGDQNQTAFKRDIAAAERIKAIPFMNVQFGIGVPLEIDMSASGQRRGMPGQGSHHELAPGGPMQ